MSEHKETGLLVDTFTREKQLMFGGATQEMGLVTDKGEKISLGCTPQFGKEMWSYGSRPADILDAAGVEVIAIDDQPLETPMR